MRSIARIVLFAAAAVVIATAALWYFESPAWTLRNMKSAAEANDVEALNAYIDYPALRQSLKAGLMARMKAKARNDRSAISTIGVALGSALVDPVIDELVSPAGIRAALVAKREEQSLGGTIREAAALRLPDRPVIVRRNFSEFLVATEKAPKSGLVFRRHGLSWELSGVELPGDPPSPEDMQP